MVEEMEKVADKLNQLFYFDWYMFKKSYWNINNKISMTKSRMAAAEVVPLSLYLQLYWSTAGQLNLYESASANSIFLEKKAVEIK